MAARKRQWRRNSGRCATKGPRTIGRSTAQTISQRNATMVMGAIGADRRAADDAIGAPHRRGQHQQQHRALVEASGGPTEKCAQSGLFPKAGTGADLGQDSRLRPAEAPCNPGKRACAKSARTPSKKIRNLACMMRPRPRLPVRGRNAPCSRSALSLAAPRRRRARPLRRNRGGLADRRRHGLSRRGAVTRVAEIDAPAGDSRLIFRRPARRARSRDPARRRRGRRPRSCWARSMCARRRRPRAKAPSTSK